MGNRKRQDNTAKELKSKRKKASLGHYFGVCFCLLMTAFFVASFINAVESYNFKKSHIGKEYVTLTVEVTRYKTHSYQNTITYTTWWEFAFDGKTGYGVYQRNINTEQEAQAQIGKKLTIYIFPETGYYSRRLPADDLKQLLPPAIVFGVLTLIVITIATNSAVRLIRRNSKHAIIISAYLLLMIGVIIYVVSVSNGATILG